MAPRRRTLENLLTVLAYGGFGVFAGTVTTFLHRGRIDLGGVPIWIGMIIGTLALLLVAIGLRLYLEQRLATSAFAIGALLGMGILTTNGFGQSVVIPGGLDSAGIIWMSLATAAVVLPAIWPRLPERATQPKRAAQPAPAASVSLPENSRREGDAS